MGKNIARYLLIALLLISGGSVLFAEQGLVIPSDQIKGYAIGKYEFSITGKTNKIALREAIVPAGGDRVYASEKELVKALDSKRQTLVNKQIFMSVEYEYSVYSFTDGILSYVVTFSIEDSSTFLALPYPKFDNNKTGLLVGVKAKDTNLFGTLGEMNLTGYTSQNDGTLQSWDNREDRLTVDIARVRFLGTSLNLNFDYARQKTTNPQGELKYVLQWSGIKVGTSTIGVSVEGTHKPIVATQQFKYSISIGGLKVTGVPTAVRTWGDLRPRTDLSAWNPELFGFSISYGPFTQDKIRYTLSTLFEFNGKLTNVKSQTTLQQHDLKFFTRPMSFNIVVTTNQKRDKSSLDNILITSTLGTNFTLPLKLRWTTSVTGGVYYVDNSAPVQVYQEYVNTLSNGGRINYFSNLHKFREGFMFSLKHVMRDYPQPEYTTKDYWYIEGSMTWFLFAKWRMNPSIRINGFYAGNNNTSYKFLPSSDLDVSDYLRGSLSRSQQIKDVNGYLSSGVVANLSLTIDFIDFGFARSYVTPFLDIGVFTSPKFDDGSSIISSIGVEGWGVLRRFPSHPMRVSLGFNTLDVMAALRDEMPFKDVEWKASISFELYF